MRSKRYIFFGSVVIMAILSIFWIKPRLATVNEFYHSAKSRTIKIGVVPLLSSSLIFIAKNRKFFNKHNVNIELIEFATGKEALHAMFSGKVDLATSSKTPIIRAALERKQFKILATIGASGREVSVLGSRKVLKSPKDLLNLTIGLASGTNAEYFLDQFLIYHGVDRTKVSIKQMSPDEILASLQSGEIGAAVAWGKTTNDILEFLGKEAHIFYIPDVFTLHWNLVASTPLASNNELSSRIILSLINAKSYLLSSDMSVEHLMKNIFLGRKLSLRPGVDQYNIDVTLGQDLILGLENETRWFLKHQNLNETLMPNYLEYVQYQELAQVSPDSVTIIR